MNYLHDRTHKNVTRTCRKKKLLAFGSWLAAAAWLAAVAIWPAGADTAAGEAGKKRTYTLAEKSIQQHLCADGQGLRASESQNDEITS